MNAMDNPHLSPRFMPDDPEVLHDRTDHLFSVSCTSMDLDKIKSVFHTLINDYIPLSQCKSFIFFSLFHLQNVAPDSIDTRSPWCKIEACERKDVKVNRRQQQMWCIRINKVSDSQELVARTRRQQLESKSYTRIIIPDVKDEPIPYEDFPITCVVCRSNQRKLVFDCGHLSMCRECTIQHVRQRMNQGNREKIECPICKTQTRTIKVVYIP
jgi:hypothetical protein